MSKITEERMREIFWTIEESAKNGRDLGLQFLNHPEIKSLFEDDLEGGEVIGLEIDYDSITYIGQDNNDIEYDCPNPDCKDYSVSDGDPCCRCGQKLIWLEDKSSCKEIVDNSNEGYEVIEYEKDEGLYSSTECPSKITGRYGDNINYVGSIACQDCKRYKGHEIEGKSIRCAFEVNNGGGGEA